MKLTDTALRNAKSAKIAYTVADGHGLFLLIQPNGAKLWRFAYRFEGKQKRLALGAYPVVTLAKAREKHIEARRALDNGIDPAAQRKAEKQSAKGDTFGDIAGLWYEHWKPHKSARYVVTMDSRLKADILPAIGSRPIAKIEAPEVIEMVKAIEARGACEIARRALEVTSQVFRYAIANGLAQRNPAADVRASDVLKPVKKTNHARVNAKELPALLAAINSYGGYRGGQTSMAMRLMSYTFLRTSELNGARWDEVNFADARWDIPAQRMKKDRPHIVPLSRQVVDLLKRLRRENENSEYLFPGVRGHMSGGTISNALKRMGYRGKMTGHGFRGVASTLLHEQGWPHEHIELQLAHAAVNAVSAAYNHALYIPQRREMMQAWADYLDNELAKALQIAGAN
ncbi:tyrosine-type recombinase/integrase [Occallatibacter riparius]|uniref:Tyrosine-type recombinase/integrase n=1 Tax=Occallatibacter riparius TaxID=1002689 RepID=A0A9J7BLR7_9BACT|nr:integrase arm-type DNA-binding domain-containing protein [Occallatibacter riparius]UWZ81838.1 tyrosine-type recombinase/integrase [Occallatibacter riparius]